jgi:hypothetical protein
MTILLALFGMILIVVALVDAFEAVVLPRRVTRALRLARLYYLSAWAVWQRLARLLPAGRRRETCLSVFGPLSLLGLFAVWVLLLIAGFALIHVGLGTPLQTQGTEGSADFFSYLYLSGVTFFTLGYGDVVPAAPLGRGLAVVEAGLGFGFLAIVIGYLPVLYQAVSSREVIISLFDARAGSPPSAAEFLLRLGPKADGAALDAFLAEGERWGAELLASQLSFPVLGYYRSQHDNQSWLAALTTFLDVCALLLAAVKTDRDYQARLTFAMCRHAVVDLALVFNTPPLAPDPDRLGPERLVRLREALAKAGYSLHEGAAADQKLIEVRALYEPFVNALGCYFRLAVPALLPDQPRVDNWRSSAWTRHSPGLTGLPLPEKRADHFD